MYPSHTVCQYHYCCIMCCLSKFAKSHDELLRPLDNTFLDESLWNDKCDYIDLEKCIDLNSNNQNLILSHLNVRSLLSNQDGIK